jgi:outer membrane receptor protein involved in Fe transport
MRVFICLVFVLVSHFSLAQVNISGSVNDASGKAALSYANVVIKTEKDSIFITGTVTNDEGRFTLSGIKSGVYVLETSFVGYKTKKQGLFVGNLTNYLDLAVISLEQDSEALGEIVVTAKQDAVSLQMDRKTFTVADNISQSGGSVLQAMSNLPGITTQNGKVQLRGSDKVAILIDGKQTALTGFGSQSSLDNIPASSIERIEIINNPSAKFDANGNAGIINIIYKKNKQEGFNGKIGLTGGLGALWERQANFPDIRPQYKATPKINPSVALNYKKNKINTFFQGDYLYKETLNKNEFVTRTYDDGLVVRRQTKRNRDTGIITTKLGMDINPNDKNLFTISGFLSVEDIIDNGDEPFFNANLTERFRLWQFLEDEVKTTAMATTAFEHKFKQPGHFLNIGFNYTFHREDEKYFFDNILPNSTSTDAFKLLSDEHVGDFNFDYVRPLKYGRFETGLKFRRRVIPTNMQFFPGIKTVIDVNAGGKATYSEIIPAVYGNYVYEDKKVEAEVGLRMEYVDLNYDVDPNHNTYKSDGYQYTQPFPTVRFAYKINADNKLSLFFNRRVDRPNEVDIRVFPKYDDAELIKVGNPALSPQFTNSLELGYKTNLSKGYLYGAAYYRFATGTITRISTVVPGSPIIYAIFQNAGKSINAGFEMVLSQNVSKAYNFNINLNGYRNQINAFTVQNLYPVPHTFTAEKQEIFSGNIKWNNNFNLQKGFSMQVSAVYLAPDIIPQGTIAARYSVDAGLKKTVNNGKGEWVLNATDIFNTLLISKEIQGNGFSYTSKDYNETQVFRLGYSYKF